MLTFDNLLKRFRIAGEGRSYQRVLTDDRYEVLTHTQACRYRELQQTRLQRKSKRKAKPHYSLKEAALELKTEVDEILMSGAAARLQCLLMPAGLKGHWHLAEGGQPALKAPIEMPTYLALTPADCREMAAYGSVNVSQLEYPADAPLEEDGVLPPRHRFILRESLWVDPARVVLKHPLPK